MYDLSIRQLTITQLVRKIGELVKQIPYEGVDPNFLYEKEHREIDTWWGTTKGKLLIDLAKRRREVTAAIKRGRVNNDWEGAGRAKKARVEVKASKDPWIVIPHMGVDPDNLTVREKNEVAAFWESRDGHALKNKKAVRDWKKKGWTRNGAFKPKRNH
jgi:hypothetical protein